MNKIKHTSKNITTFGGLNFIFDALYRSELPKFLNHHLGSRHYAAQYTYADITLSLFANSLCQGEYISDVKVLKEKYKDQWFTKIPSADTIEYACQELKVKTLKQIKINKKGKEITHEENYNQRMNRTLVALGVKTNQLKKEGKSNVLDFDNMVVATEKQDTRTSYKGYRGYHPNVAFIERLPVHIENHNGNTPARYEQTQTLERCFENLEAEGVPVEYFRADSASYQEEVINLVKKKTTYFYIRIPDFSAFREQCGKITMWETIRINVENKEVGTTLFSPFGNEESFRIVVTRSLKKTGQIDIESGTAYDYYGIITNNIEQTNQEVIEFYNQRGDAENSNRYLLNDFNWHHLPFMDMDTNTVYMYLMAMGATLFEWIKSILVTNKAHAVTLTMRTKAFCFHYICVATSFIRHARQKILHVFSTQEYCILKI